jgi:hypothetical protein
MGVTGAGLYAEARTRVSIVELRRLRASFARERWVHIELQQEIKGDHRSISTTWQ